MADQAGGTAEGNTTQAGDESTTDLLGDQSGEGGTTGDGAGAADQKAGQGESQAGGDQQVAGDLLGGEGDGTGDDTQPTGAPEQYEPLTAPEGVEIDEKLQGRFFEVGKELNLPQAAMQKLFDFQQQLATEAAEASEAATARERQAQQQQEQQLRADQKAFERDPAFKETVSTAKIGLEGVFSPESVQILRELGATKHPSVVRDLAKNIGSRIKEDTVGGGEAGTRVEKPTLGKRLFPHLPD